MDKQNGPKGSSDLATLGAIVAEAVDRRRDGQAPSAEEYWRRFPHLRSQIEAHFEMIALLESPLAGPLRRGADRGVEARIASLPPDVRDLIALRGASKRPWDEIARRLGRPEEELRRAYARAIKTLIDPAAPSKEMGQRQ